MLHARADLEHRGILRFLLRRERPSRVAFHGRARPARRGRRTIREKLLDVLTAALATSKPGGTVPAAIPATIVVAAGAHDRSPRAAHLDRLPLLDHRIRNFIEEAGLPRRCELAVSPPLLGVREIELRLGARDPDVEQPALLLEERRIVVRFCERKKAILES